MAEVLYIIDAHSLIYQVFHAVPLMTSPKGQPTNAVYGFTRDVLSLLRQKKPDYLVCAFDSPGPTFRHDVYAAYKANRGPMPDDLQPQIPLIHEVLKALHVPVLAEPGLEADDVFGSVARRAADDGKDVYVVTSDKDASQLIDGRIRVYNLRKDHVLDADGLHQQLGIRPDQVIDMMALSGDPTDNVPGVPGIGPKKAVALIQQFGSLEGVLANTDRIRGAKTAEAVRTHVDDIRISCELVTIKTDVPIEVDWDTWRARVPRYEDVGPLFAEFGFRRFLEQITASDKPPAPPLVAHRVDSAAAYRDFRRQLAKQTRISVDLETTSVSPMLADIVGVAFSWQPGEGWYLVLRGPKTCKHLDAHAVLSDLKPMLEDPTVAKVGQNLKYDILVLRRAGIRLCGVVFDTMVADYLLEAGQRNHGLDDLAMRYLGHKTIPISDLIGKGRSQIRMDEVDTDTVAEYAAEDAEVALRLTDRLADALEQNDLGRLFDTVELPLIDVLVEMEHNGVKVDTAMLQEISREFAEKMTELEQQIYSAAGHEFNIGSPKQLSAVLFEEIGLSPLRRTKTGASTDQAVLEQLALVHPLPSLVIEHRKLSKLRSTYLDALPQMVHPETGRIHASFNQVVTATGRLSSSDPNLQNIPVRTPEGRRIRQAFIPGSDDQVLLTADYSQVELRVLAHYSRDEQLCGAFHRDEDIHTFVAGQVFGVPREEVTSEMRRAAKTVNFGIIYGLSPFGLASRLGMAQEEAGAFIDAYFAKHQGVEEFITEVLESAGRNGYVSTILGRRRAITGIRPTRTRQRNLAERTAINTVIQGSAADLIKVAMNNIHRRLQTEHSRCRMVLQIHDELVFETPRADIEPLKQMVDREMVGALDLSVPLKVDMAYGQNWLEVA